jgi:hypothetical protein
LIALPLVPGLAHSPKHATIMPDPMPALSPPGQQPARIRHRVHITSRDAAAESRDELAARCATGAAMQESLRLELGGSGAG